MLPQNLKNLFLNFSYWSCPVGESFGRIVAGLYFWTTGALATAGALGIAGEEVYEILDLTEKKESTMK